MTSTSVTKLQTVVTNVTKTNTSTAGSQINTLGSSFSQIMSKAEGSKTADAGVKPAQKKTTTEPQDAFAKQVSSDKQVNTDGKVSNDKAPQAAQSAQETQTTEDTTGKAAEEVTDAAKNVLKETAEELNVSEEEVLEAMEVLGLSLLDLLNPENMTELVLQVSGEADMLSLLTDADLYQSVQTLIEAVNAENAGLQEILSMDEAQTAGFIEELKQQGADIMPEDMLAQKEAVKTTEEAPFVTVLEEDAPEENSSVRALQQSVSNETEAPMDNTLRTAEPTNRTEHESAERNDTKGKENDQSQSFLTQQPANAGTTQNTVFEEQTFSPATAEETRQIMNQILDYVRVNVTSDLSEMEMHLHPESLGNVRIVLAAKDGIVTAQFKAESELVKSALEAQMVQLKDSLDEKGVKVEAIEVTVESHAFERNLEQGNNSQSNGDPQEPKKRSARRINLNAAEGVDGMEDGSVLEGLEDADRITAEMMAQAGNTVDFTA